MAVFNPVFNAIRNAVRNAVAPGFWPNGKFFGTFVPPPTIDLRVDSAGNTRVDSAGDTRRTS